MPRKIIIDTDPGQDDAVAILTALAAPEALDVLGITTVAGNVPLHLTTANALRLVELADRRDVPVFAGADRPIRRPLVTAEHVHGKTGLDGANLPDPQHDPDPRHAVDFLVETLRNEPSGTVTLATLGPLTNIALALEQAPDIAGRIAGIVMMGGAYFEVGNITPTAEFNIYVDPEAADIVFRSGVPITMHGLDVTHQMLTTHERLGLFAALGNRTGQTIAGMLGFSERFDLAKYGGKGAPLHDPCVTAYLLKPDLFEGRHVNVMVETQSELTLGMTVVDYWQVTKRPHNAFFIRSGDADGFYALLLDKLARLP